MYCKDENPCYYRGHEALSFAKVSALMFQIVELQVDRIQATLKILLVFSCLRGQFHLIIFLHLKNNSNSV